VRNRRSEPFPARRRAAVERVSGVTDGAGRLGISYPIIWIFGSIFRWRVVWKHDKHPRRADGENLFVYATDPDQNGTRWKCGVHVVDSVMTVEKFVRQSWAAASGSPSGPVFFSSNSVFLIDSRKVPVKISIFVFDINRIYSKLYIFQMRTGSHSRVSVGSKLRHWPPGTNRKRSCRLFLQSMTRPASTCPAATEPLNEFRVRIGTKGIRDDASD
jgi:hypothetical protein